MRSHLIYFAWVVSFAAMAGSLYFSEALGFQPCVLCWYQRILMYPLVIIIPIGILTADQKIQNYVLPFSILGMAAALYHYLLSVQVIPENIAPCGIGVSCVTQPIEWFGFANIPLLSFISFTLVTLSMLAYSKSTKNEYGK